ncbi:hypothetical protein GCM10009821_12750 [Aeromicrobium halocynthiae]|uniref:Uncharacterized protein n=1 Tax=Aeromicrobium halocynthiae TaxID=560557 RepID=A0ABN2VWE9_9ACTN
MSPDPQPAPADPARTFRILVLALVGAVPVITVAVALVLPAEGTSPDPLTVGVCVAVVLGAALAARLIGFRVPTLPAGSDARNDDAVRRESLNRFQSSTMLRFAVTEAGFIIVLAWTFVADEGPWPLLVVALPAAVLILLNCWPSRANVDRVATALEADGARSGLRETFGHA